MKTESMSLKKRKEWHMGGFGGRKWEVEHKTL